MRRPRRGSTTGAGARNLALVGAILVAAGSAATAAAAAPAGPGTNDLGGTGSMFLVATGTGPTYAPTFTGNGELGVRVPPEGQGYQGGAVPTQSELAGFYAQAPGGVQQRANIPTWTTLTFGDAGQPFDLATGQTTHWQQDLDLRSGTIRTTARWTAPDGHVTDLDYEVLTDRSRPDVGLVRLTLVPHWSGTATVTDAIDGSPATLSTSSGQGWSSATRQDWVQVQAMGTGITVAVASQLGTSPDVAGTVTPVDQGTAQSVGQQLAFPVTAGHTYVFTKYVGVVSSQSGAVPVEAARSQAAAAAATGFPGLQQANDAAWAQLWAGRIDVLGDPTLATEVNASEFYLWSSTRRGVNWSISPAGLSSNGYNGHIFWDAETWMYPALLAQHPDLAAGMNTYRAQRLGAAQAHAAATGAAGARFPWESALDGSEQIPPPADVFTEGRYEQHITADIALAQWQYFLATGNVRWLATRGWPVISAAAAFWASRVTPGASETSTVDGVTGPDEENPDVDGEVYTVAAARQTLEAAIDAAQVLGQPAPAVWSQIAAGLLAAPSGTSGAVPEFSGYAGQLVKQADVTMLEYPLDAALPAATEQDDLDYYTPRTDPGGPSMSDSIASIDSAELGTPGCSAGVFTQRSVTPFVRDDFDQFSETRTGGVFTFMTGIGGFLQEFLYGYSGLRWNAQSVVLAPTLDGQLAGVVLHDLAWHGRRFTVAIGPRTTSVEPTGGPALPVRIAGRRYLVAPGHRLTVPTRRPDLVPTTDVVRCASVTASSAQTGSPALAAVDGSPATGWQAAALPAVLTVPVTGGARTVGVATLQWGQQWPPAPTSTRSPPPSPVVTLRATSYTVAVSSDGTAWHTVAQVTGRSVGTTDVLHFAPVRARAVRVTVTASTGDQPPLLEELTVTR